ncbi:hypothetical protein ABB02_01451 [Clostridiaceae bacterium JG1575]|nr:hypothetical protein ABB02_01451 [Clostridiaceae bacterium JG1575]
MKRVWQRRLQTKRKGSLLLELCLAFLLISLLLTWSLPRVSIRAYQEKTADRLFVQELKSSILKQRMEAARTRGKGFVFDLPGDGRVVFKTQGKIVKVIEDPLRRCYVLKRTYAQITTLRTFKNTTERGQTGFTLTIEKRGEPMARLIFQVGTSSIREEWVKK